MYNAKLPRICSIFSVVVQKVLRKNAKNTSNLFHEKSIFRANSQKKKPFSNKSQPNKKLFLRTISKQVHI